MQIRIWALFCCSSDAERTPACNIAASVSGKHFYSLLLAGDFRSASTSFVQDMDSPTLDRRPVCMHIFFIIYMFKHLFNADSHWRMWFVFNLSLQKLFYTLRSHLKGPSYPSEYFLFYFSFLWNGKYSRISLTVPCFFMRKRWHIQLFNDNYFSVCVFIWGGSLATRW